MRIIHILPELKQGGVETVVVGMTREMVKAGHECIVISNGGKLAGQIERDGGRHITLDVCSKNPLTFPFRARQLRNILCSLRPDILHVHSRIPAWLAWYANKKPCIPFVTTVHGFNSVNKYSKIMTKGDRVICVSNPVKAYIQKQYGTAGERISVIHPGIDPAVFDPDKVEPAAVDALKSSFGLQGCFVASSIGRITGLKDYETFIRAIAEAVQGHPDIRGLIVGNIRADKKDYYNRLQQLVSELNVQKHIHFATHCTSMPEVYGLSDVVVSCSKKPESFGLTLVEALSMNIPVIATRHGGPLDIIHEGKNGYFFEPGDSAELTGLLTKPLVHETDLRTDTVQRFSLHTMAQANLSVYKELSGT